MPGFDRAQPWAGVSLAMVVFRRQFTELNDQYWAVLPAELLTRRLVRDHPASTVEAALGVSGGDWHRVGHDVDTLAGRFTSSRSWARLLTLVLVASAVDLYIENVTRAAQLSDPALRSGFPKDVDGALLLKRGVDIEVDPKRFSQGDWSSRLSQYEKTFGSAPAALRDNIGHLDAMRRTRNRVAHTFGLDSDDHPFGYLSDSSARVSQKRLQGWLATVDSVVGAVDGHLRSEFIGDFETVELLHLWKQDRLLLMKAVGVELAPSALASARPFMKLLAHATGRKTSGKQYWQELDRFYRSI